MLRCRLSVHLVDDASEQDVLDVATVLQSAYATRPDLVPADEFGGAVAEINANCDEDQPVAFPEAIWDDDQDDPVGLRVEVGIYHEGPGGEDNQIAWHSHTLDLPRTTHSA